MHRTISFEQAAKALCILVEECGYRLHSHDGESFLRSVVTPADDDGTMWDRVCNEYRFCGALGFGGKFRNNGNNNNTPYVDCYQEDETPERRAMIERANRRLAELFKPEQAS